MLCVLARFNPEHCYEEEDGVDSHVEPQHHDHGGEGGRLSIDQELVEQEDRILILIYSNT